MKSNKHLTRALALLLGLTASLMGAPSSALAASPKDARAQAYARAKKTMSPDLYLVYRVTERILVANDIKRPIRIAVRKNVDCAAAGLDPNSAKCERIALLPEIDKATNFDIWAAQVVGTITGDPNAYAFSDAGALYINIAMLKELTGKIDQVACVVGHEIAHITQNHSEEKRKKSTQVDIKTGDKISRAVKNAHNAQQARRTMALMLGALSDGLSGTNTSMQQIQMSFAVQDIYASQIAPQIAQEALKLSPEVGNAYNNMQGLTPDFVKRTVKDVNNYLRDHALEMYGYSRQLEYEADLLGLEYVKAAGFDAGACKLMWTETMPHTQDKLITKLLPKGVQDPGVQTIAIKKDPYEGLSAEEIRKQTFEKSMAKKEEQPEQAVGKIESDQVPEDVMKQLMSSHPDGLSRAAAIEAHLNDKTKMSQLAQKGANRLKTVSVRNWSYDDQSQTTIISQELVRPEEAGRQNNGTTGIDVDKRLGF